MPVVESPRECGTSCDPLGIAVGQGFNPITKTNWEGTGVKPDVPVRADLALPTSLLLALEGLADKAPNLDQREELVQSVVDARAELDRLKRGR